jgi:hypothetical protein
MISVGSERQLHDADVWKLPYQFQHRRLHDEFRSLQGSVIRRLLVANGLDLVITSGLGILEMIAGRYRPIKQVSLLMSIQI